jgi:Ca2+-binding RTX toxin-like protein
MSVAGPITIGGGSSPVHYAFTATGTATLAFAQQFANTVDAAFTAGTYTIVDLDTPTGGHVPPPGAPVLTFYEFTQGQETYTIPAGGGYLLDSVSGQTTIVGSAAGGDNVLVAAVNIQATYIAEGGDNIVTFVNGNNLYIGDSVGGDNIAAGSGFDTIITGTGDTTVYGGAGAAKIFLNDTGTALANDKVWLHDGSNSVYAGGTGDVVGVDAATAQTIFGGTNAAAYLNVVLGGGGGNLVVAGAGTTGVFDDSSNNSIFGGSGQLTVVTGGDINTSVVGGSGAVYVFGNAGTNVAFANDIGDTASANFIANAGSETYNGGAGTVNQYIFGYLAPNATVGASVNEQLTGGSGNNLLVSGSGQETLTGGSALNAYLINGAAQDASIVLSDFATKGLGLVEFANVDQSDLMNAINNGQAGSITINGTSTVDYQITFQDGTQVTFVGINSAAELNGKII